MLYIYIYMSYSLNSLKGFIWRSSIGVIKGMLDYSSYGLGSKVQGLGIGFGVYCYGMCRPPQG